MSPVYQLYLSGSVDRFTTLTLFHVPECKHGWESRNRSPRLDSEDKCGIEGKDGWRLNNVSVLVPALISHCSQERCILL